MNITEQLAILEAAQGDSAKLALLAVDFAYPAMSEVERMFLKETLEAVAIPHWCDEKILAALLQISETEAGARLRLLRKLNVVELFPARGEGAVNVHEMTRLALRKQMQQNKREYFRMLSEHAEFYFDEIPHTAASRIERLYHLLTAHPKRGVSECEILCQEWTGQSYLEDQYALVLALKELRTCELVTDDVWAEVQLCVSRMSPRSGLQLAAEIYAAYVETEHDRLIQKIFFMVILPLYFMTIWIAIFVLAEEPYESTFKWATAIVVGNFLFAFQRKIRAILAKLFLHDKSKVAQ